jgi:hypothetical protein
MKLVSSCSDRFPLPGCLAFGVNHGKLDADLRTNALLGTPSVKSVHDYYPFAVEDGGRLTPMAVVMVDPRSLRSKNYVRMQHFVRRPTLVPFRRFWGDVRREFIQRLSTALHDTLGFYLRDALHEGSAGVVVCLLVPRA